MEKLLLEQKIQDLRENAKKLGEENDKTWKAMEEERISLKDRRTTLGERDTEVRERQKRLEDKESAAYAAQAEINTKLNNITTEINECMRNRDSAISQKNQKLERDSKARLQRSMEESQRLAAAHLVSSAPLKPYKKSTELQLFNSRFNGRPRQLCQKVRGLSACKSRFGIPLPDDFKTAEQFWSNWDPSTGISVEPDSITVSPDEALTTDTDIIIPKLPDHFVGVILLTTKMAGQTMHPFSRLVFLGHNKFGYTIDERTKTLTKTNEEMRCYGGDFDDTTDDDLEACARRHLLAQTGLDLPEDVSLRKFANFQYEQRQSTYYLCCLDDHKVTIKKIERTYEIEIPAPKEDKPKPSPAKETDGDKAQEETKEGDGEEEEEKAEAEEDAEMKESDESAEPKTAIKKETVAVLQPCAIILSQLLEQHSRTQVSVEIRMVARLLEEMMIYRQGKKLLSALRDMNEKRKLSDSTLAPNPLEEATNRGNEPGKLKRRKTTIETTDFSDKGCLEFFDKLANIAQVTDNNHTAGVYRQAAYRYVLTSLTEPDLSLGQINKLIGGPENYMNLHNLFVTTETDVQTDLSELTPFDTCLFYREG